MNRFSRVIYKIPSLQLTSLNFFHGCLLAPPSAIIW